MREAWADLLEKADLALAACAGVVAKQVLHDTGKMVRDARLRLAYPEEVTVVALVGGTGSGKSSLLNAIVGAEIADTGGIRPTTAVPMAVTPQAVGERLDDYLQELGIVEVHHSGPHDWLCLIDMPDTDSVEVGHRLEVERLVPVVDAVAWVVDPEKYRDASFHRRQIAPRAGAASRFVFVLNQADRLDAETSGNITADLIDALSEDGIDDPALVLTAADPPAGPPQGIDDLLAALSAQAGSREAVYRKLRSDLRETVETLLAATGGTGLDFEARAADAVAEAMTAISRRDETTAVLGLTAFLDDLASESGEELATQIEAMAIRVPVEVRRVAEGAGPPLSETVVAPVRTMLGRRARANAALAELDLALRSVEGEDGR